jgi:hypothetical protein
MAKPTTSHRTASEAPHAATRPTQTSKASSPVESIRTHRVAHARTATAATDAAGNPATDMAALGLPIRRRTIG